MSKTSRDNKKAAAVGKPAAKSKKAKELVEEPVKEAPVKKGYPAACCRCKSYKRTADDGAKCKVTGKHTARKHVCEKFNWKD